MPAIDKAEKDYPLLQIDILLTEIDRREMLYLWIYNSLVRNKLDKSLIALRDQALADLKKLSDADLENDNEVIKLLSDHRFRSIRLADNMIEKSRLYPFFNKEFFALEIKLRRSHSSH